MEYIRKPNRENRLLDCSKDGVRYLQFPALNQLAGVKHLFSTREGGCSEGCLSTMNLSYVRGDKKENVDENYRRIAGILDCKMEDFVLSDQTHTTNIRIVSDDDRGKGVTKPKEYTDVDGLVTNKRGIVLVTSFADCVPLYLVDPVKQVIGLSHSGWRGTVGRIGEKTIQVMKQEYGCKPEEMIAAIGPSICQSCYEVDEDVAARFLEEFAHSRSLNRMVEHRGNGKYLLDLWAANREVLLQAGITREHLSVTDICTCCNSQLLFSHRASHGKRGNLSAFLMLS